MIPVTVTFYGDVGFDRSYNHIIDFSNQEQRNNYFNSRILKTVNDCAYNKPMNTIQIRCDYEQALKFTYCKFIIGSNPLHRKEIYAWVDDVVLITDQAEGNVYTPLLQITISIDPIQTFIFDFTIGESFVVREHVDRFKSNGDGTKGWCLDNTSDVSSLGLEKRIKDCVELKKSVPVPLYSPIEIYWFLIQVVENVSGEVPHSQTMLYFVPVQGGTGSYNFEALSGLSSAHKPMLNLRYIYDDTYLHLLGIDPEKVASVHYIPFDIFPVYRDETTGYFKIGGSEDWRFNIWYDLDSNKNFAALKSSVSGSILSDNFNIEIWRDFEFTNKPDNKIPSGNPFYSSKYEPQLYKNPYQRVEIIDENGISKGQLPDISANIENGFKGVRLRLLIDTVEVRLRVIPYYSIENPNIETDNSYWVEFALTTVDVIRNNWLSYLLQERETTRQMISSQINQRAIANAIGGVSGGLSQGGSTAVAQGAAAGGAGLALGLGTSALSTVGSYITDKHFAFEQQDIREKAVQRKANNITQQGTFKSKIGDLRIVLVKCDETTFDIKANEFKKYGYSVFKYETPNIKSRKYFNFIATNIVKINGDLNNSIKMAIAQVFNNGVTIWHGDYIDELTGIGDYSLENIERSLI